MTIPGSGTLVQRAEAIRKELGAPAVTYISLTIDNTRGAESTYVYQFLAVLDGGRQLETKDILDDWRRMASAKDNSALHNRIIALSNETATAVPGGKVTTFFMFPEVNVMPERLNVYINGGFERTEICRYAE